MNKNIETRIQTISLLLLTAIAITAALFWLRTVFIPFVLAVFISACFKPIIDFQIRVLGVRRGIATFTTLFISAMILFYLIALSATTITTISNNIILYQDQIDEAARKIYKDWSLEKFGVQYPSNESMPINFSYYLGQTISSMMGILSNGMLVVIFVMFMIVGKHSSDFSEAPFVKEIENRITKYILTLLFISGLTGILVGTSLYFIKVPFPLMFGTLTFLLNFIPNIGSIIAIILPLPIAFMSPDLSVFSKFLVLLIPGLIQFVLGNIVQPKLMGRSLDMHPVTVMLALIFFGVIWGVVGMFIATPLTAILKIVFEKVEITKPFADLMSGRIDTIGALLDEHKEN
ncbi:MAG: AI-2E family transporter [Candidatus Omnitrophica bacterium]|nr:AI-2E family transporter [Candidatus Omnitrophota bacterium]